MKPPRPRPQKGCEACRKGITLPSSCPSCAADLDIEVMLATTSGDYGAFVTVTGKRPRPDYLSGLLKAQKIMQPILNDWKEDADCDCENCVAQRKLESAIRREREAAKKRRG